MTSGNKGGGKKEIESYRHEDKKRVIDAAAKDLFCSGSRQ